ncbi:MAG: hypothetical protein AABZ06_08070 [Bdellovibrionota bacterium]
MINILKYTYPFWVLLTVACLAFVATTEKLAIQIERTGATLTPIFEMIQ